MIVFMTYAIIYSVANVVKKKGNRSYLFLLFSVTRHNCLALKRLLLSGMYYRLQI